MTILNILQVSRSSDGGGAPIATMRLNKALRRSGVNSRCLTLSKGSLKEGVLSLNSPFYTMWGVATRLMERWPTRLTQSEHSMLSSSWVPGPVARKINQISPDVVNLHWVNRSFLSIAAIPKIEAPKVWTLHDMWAFAGAEHYVGDSLRYKTGYLKNNRDPGESRFDLNRWVWLRKKKHWAAMDDLVVVTPSQWLAQCARESVLFGHVPIEVIPNGIDHELFKPVDKNVARDILGLTKEKKLILFGAGNATTDKRKGFHLLKLAIDALENMQDRDRYELVVFGADSGGEQAFKTKVHYLGNLHDQISLAVAYSAVDVFVAPSLQDNLPNTVLEALSCATPVVAFNTGGMPDMIDHEKNGYLACAFEPEDLACGMNWVLENETRWHQLSKQARATVVNNFTLAHQARRYTDLYMRISNK